MMTYNNSFSPRKLIKLLIELLNVSNNIFNIDYFLKTTSFIINHFVCNPEHQKEYKLLLFKTITDTLAMEDSLKCLYNVFIRHLIDCTDRHLQEELVKLMKYIVEGKIEQKQGFRRLSSGVVNSEFDDFELNDLLKLPENLSEKVTEVIFIYLNSFSKMIYYLKLKIKQQINTKLYIIGKP